MHGFDLKKTSMPARLFFANYHLKIKLRLTIPWRVFLEPDRLAPSSHLQSQLPTASAATARMKSNTSRIKSPPFMLMRVMITYTLYFKINSLLDYHT